MTEPILQVDETDRVILAILQENARTHNAEIARRLGMAPSAILERIRKLEERGVIIGFEARIAPSTLDLGMLAFVFVRSDEQLGASETARRLAAIPEVLEVHLVAGEDCLLVKLRCQDTNALTQLLNERFGSIEKIRSTRTTIVLNTIKESSCLPIEGVERAHAAASEAADD